MAKKRKSNNSSDAMERRLNSLAAAVLAMMERSGQGARQTYRDFNPEDAFNYPSPQMFSQALGGDTVGEGSVSDFANEVTNNRAANPMASRFGDDMAAEVANRASDKYMQDVYRLILANMRQGGGAAGRRVR